MLMIYIMIICCLLNAASAAMILPEKTPTSTIAYHFVDHRHEASTIERYEINHQAASYTLAIKYDGAMANDAIPINISRQLNYIFQNIIFTKASGVLIIDSLEAVWAAAVAQYAKKISIPAYILCVNQANTLVSPAHLLLCKQHDSIMYYCKTEAQSIVNLQAINKKFKHEYKTDLYNIDHNLHEACAISYAHAINELAEQIASGIIQEPTLIFPEQPTPSMIAGMLIGIANTNLASKIVIFESDYTQSITKFHNAIINITEKAYPLISSISQNKIWTKYHDNNLIIIPKDEEKMIFFDMIIPDDVQTKLLPKTIACIKRLAPFIYSEKTPNSCILFWNTQPYLYAPHDIEKTFDYKNLPREFWQFFAHKPND